MCTHKLLCRGKPPLHSARQCHHICCVESLPGCAHNPSCRAHRYHLVASGLDNIVLEGIHCFTIPKCPHTCGWPLAEAAAPAAREAAGAERPLRLLRTRLGIAIAVCRSLPLPLTALLTCA